MNILDIAPVVPVVVLDDPERAVPLARALLDGGVGIIEITLRTNAALPAIEAIAAEVPEMVVGAGTLVTPLQVEAAVAAGARFLVSPGTTPNLLDALADTGLPYLPGVATISEILTVLERGITEMKFFPAESSGGTTALRAFAGPLPQARFCPTGGITPATARDYLALPNVGCVGGSWLTPAAALAAADWPGIRDRAAATTARRE
ncbi:bifunctional 4-hydroxy-2-oxoglutarate aldolase/2-dehydro-3-deoxy-phosphogluconate aldolase [Nocardia vaccinii]|uniref:bifunctional 4-hydroxy-2-oxoglutarate aldolase/2-dehydro-3-deoxy-phosphogluconate aldolase n=1 Tax=Nocardia vaccinii TaxID=1822 RepID=UPI00082FF48F|nr:bifunctional 4-hydroxy-2-oxoglutarate aldolase/2-dehydro-3-deoxy-phosphogluconate aldolase [Nocardia vaccinii]